MANGIGTEGLYTFHGGRDSANPSKQEEKARLKRWVTARCKELGIPIDETLSNEGFVEAPNDCMAFDFSEIWKCKRNFAVNLPPLGYDIELHGEWSGTDLIPPIGLVGDAVTEPFWIAGVGLQRGWNGIMDACYVIDNLYNMELATQKEHSPSSSWDEHMARIHNVLPLLHECSHDGRMTKEGLQGEYADQGPVMTQLNKQSKDTEKPQWQLGIDPFSRYEPFAKLVADKYKGAKVLENAHPVVQRSLALFRRRGAEGGLKVFPAKAIVSVSGKFPPNANVLQQKPKDSQLHSSLAADDVAVSVNERLKPPVIPCAEVVKAASDKSGSLQSMIARHIDSVLTQPGANSISTPFDDSRWKELPAHEACGFAKMAEQQWDVMTEAHLSVLQKAELQHIRNMQTSLQQQISALQKSFEAFKQAEVDLLMNSKP